ncbi:glycosyltransferase family 9 protein [Lentilitoribacter sp. Alg239-R112]|uniref:glycosyltransferase family 9 protein n=1 Tax=Lentilitoribacter sp. Alg239-R112 TaxID=2305987 RepID=UPI0013A6DBD3|nr:glycosyltransferase family 9 protein [Lentilitoribacter sp. Alg239-R112]
MNILLGQLGSNGDCLYATTLARQIKTDMPDCHLTWAILSLYKPVLRNNPDVDEILEIPTKPGNDHGRIWHTFEQEVMRRQSGANPFYDRTIMSQIWPAHFERYDGTVRPSILRGYENPITVPIKTIVELDDEEMENVSRFISKHNLKSFDQIVVFECSSKSGQSHVTPEFGAQVARNLTRRLPNVAVILATHLPTYEDKNIFNGAQLSMREIGGLLQITDLFIGCGSGLTVISTSTVAKEIPNIQILNGSTSVYASFAHDFEYFGQDTSHFIELHDVPTNVVADISLSVLTGNFQQARDAFHQTSKIPSFNFYLDLISQRLLHQLRYCDAARSLSITADRYGWVPELINFARCKVAPMIFEDPSYIYPAVKLEMRRFLDTIADTTNMVDCDRA